jgi:hypothetical protein
LVQSVREFLFERFIPVERLGRFDVSLRLLGPEIDRRWPAFGRSLGDVSADIHRGIVRCRKLLHSIPGLPVGIVRVAVGGQDN